MRSDLNSQNEDQNNNQHDPDCDHHDHGRFDMSILVGGGLPLLNKSFTAADSGTTFPAVPVGYNITNLSGAGYTVYGDYQDLSFTLTGQLNASTSLSNV